MRNQPEGPKMWIPEEETSVPGDGDPAPTPIEEVHEYYQVFCGCPGVATDAELTEPQPEPYDTWPTS